MEALLFFWLHFILAGHCAVSFFLPFGHRSFALELILGMSQEVANPHPAT
jgi:hypothetical protein